MNSRLFNCFENELFSNGYGFWQDTNFIWINKIHKQTSNDPWTNNVRHSVIICDLRLFKTRKIENLVGEFGLLLWYEISQMREQEISFHEVWKGQIFLCDWGLQRGTGKPLTADGPSSRLEKKPTINSWMRHALCDSVLSYERNRWKFEHVIRNSMGNEIWSIYNDKYFEIWIFYT